MMAAPIYLDYQATTPLDPDVLEVMLPYLQGKFGNPHSSSHRYGWEGKAAVDVARAQVATLIGAAPEEVIFTSGATESNNLALRGVMEAGSRNRLVTVATEHSCVLETALDLRARGYDLTLLPVDGAGLIRLEDVAAALGDDVALISVMLVNNEIGVIQPVAEIARLACKTGTLVHCDAAQAVGKIPVSVADLGVDLLSVSAHKLYGPKGVGALYARKGTVVRPQITGGGQEGGLRSGTLSPALCAGMGKACAIAEPHDRFAPLWQRMVAALDTSGVAFQINGSTMQRFFGNLNVSFPNLHGARLLADLRGLALSSGAACASAAGKKSYVLEALGVPDEVAQATLRIGFGRSTTDAECDAAIAILLSALTAQKRSS